MTRTAALSAAVFLVAGCGQATAPAESGPANSGGTSLQPVYVAAVNHPGRTGADRERDANRKPGEVLEFFGIEPGMDVLDMYSGGGYYTEIVSRIVGPDGSVHAHSNSAYADFLVEETEARYGGGRLDNVDILMAENNELELTAGTYDAILMVLTYHDIYFVAPEQNWPKIDGPALMAELHKGLRPGGVLGVIDHYAAPGSPAETGQTLHRIDPQIVISEIEAAGFRLEGQSDLLRNPDDDHSQPMDAPGIRGRTDRFVLRFVKTS